MVLGEQGNYIYFRGTREQGPNLSEQGIKHTIGKREHMALLTLLGLRKSGRIQFKYFRGTRDKRYL